MVAHRRTPHGKATRGCRSGAPSTPLHEFGGLPATRPLNASDSFRKTWARCSHIHGGAASKQPRCPYACVGPALPRPWGLCPWERVRHRNVCGTGCAVQVGWADELRGIRARGPFSHCGGNHACAMAATVRLPRIRSRSRTHRLGQGPLCAPHSTATACSLRGAREGGATGAGCEGTVNRTRCGEIFVGVGGRHRPRGGSEPSRRAPRARGAYVLGPCLGRGVRKRTGRRE